MTATPPPRPSDPMLNKHHSLILLTLASTVFLSCKEGQKPSKLQNLTHTLENNPSSTPPPSQNHALPPEQTSAQLEKNFPLLPLIEPELWKKLLVQEALTIKSPTSKQHQQQARQKAQNIINRLQELHPFTDNAQSMSLGGISYSKASGQIELMARVNDLKNRRRGEQEDIEVVLCNDKGRVHESLFVTEARPLHLEIILHLAGFNKVSSTNTASQFKIFIAIPNQAPVPIRQFLTHLPASQRKLPPNPMHWEFSGSPFSSKKPPGNTFYQPDLNGDLIIGWHAHASVLQSSEENIANNITRLRATSQAEFPPGLPVKIILSPIKATPGNDD